MSDNPVNFHTVPPSITSPIKDPTPAPVTPPITTLAAETLNKSSFESPTSLDEHSFAEGGVPTLTEERVNDLSTQILGLTVESDVEGAEIDPDELLNDASILDFDFPTEFSEEVTAPIALSSERIESAIEAKLASVGQVAAGFRGLEQGVNATALLNTFATGEKSDLLFILLSDLRALKGKSLDIRNADVMIHREEKVLIAPMRNRERVQESMKEMGRAHGFNAADFQMHFIEDESWGVLTQFLQELNILRQQLPPPLAGKREDSGSSTSKEEEAAKSEAPLNKIQQATDQTEKSLPKAKNRSLKETERILTEYTKQQIANQQFRQNVKEQKRKAENRAVEDLELKRSILKHERDVEEIQNKERRKTERL